MPFTNGTFTYTANSMNPAVPSTVISSTSNNALLADGAAGLSMCVLKDGTQTITASLPMNNFKHTGVLVTSGTTSRTEYATGAGVQSTVTADAGATGGTTTAFTATLVPAITAYEDKAFYRWQYNAACGDNPTVNLNTVGARKIYKNVGGVATQLASGDVQANFVGLHRYDASLDSATGGFWLLNPAATAGGTFSGDIVMSGASIVEAEGAAVTAASSTNIWGGDGNTIHITGNTTIADFATAPQAGAWMKLIFDGTPTLTQSANLNLNNGGSDIVIQAGDMAFVYADTTTQMDVFVTRKTGRSISASPGAWALITTQTASSSASLSLTGFNSALYSDYKIVIDTILPVTDNTDLYLRTSTNGGSSYDSGGSDYAYAVSGIIASAGIVSASSNAAGQILLNGGANIGNVAGEAVSGTVYIVNPGAAQRCNMTWQIGGKNGAPNTFSLSGFGQRNTAADVDAVQLIMASGNIASGVAKLYGLVL